MKDEDLEAKLRALPPQAPGPELDARMARLWFDGPKRRRSPFSWRIPLWQAAAACLIAATAGFALRPMPEPAEPLQVAAPEPVTETIVYVIQQEPQPASGPSLRSRPMFLELQTTADDDGSSI